MNDILNLGVHANLIELGYAHQHFDAVYEECGGVENGPALDFYPAFDCYESPEDRIIIDTNGKFVNFEVRDLEQEAFLFNLFHEDLINNASSY